MTVGRWREKEINAFPLSPWASKASESWAHHYSKRHSASFTPMHSKQNADIAFCGDQSGRQPCAAATLTKRREFLPSLCHPERSRRVSRKDESLIEKSSRIKCKNALYPTFAFCINYSLFERFFRSFASLTRSEWHKKRKSHSVRMTQKIKSHSVRMT